MFADVKGFRMAYDDSGQGTALILIHGFPLCRKMWEKQVEALASAGYRVITPDLRGFGESGATAEGYDMDSLADDIVALMDSLGIKKAAVGGMSMGGYILHCLLDRHKDRITAAVFIVTRSGADTKAAREKRDDLARDVDGGRPEAVADFFESSLFAGHTKSKSPDLVLKVRAWMLATDPGVLKCALIGMRDRRDYLNELHRFDIPSLVIGGEMDVCIPPENAEATAKGLPDARIEIIENAGHMANMEEPEAFNRCMLGFLGTRLG